MWTHLLLDMSQTIDRVHRTLLIIEYGLAGTSQFIPESGERYRS